MAEIAATNSDGRGGSVHAAPRSKKGVRTRNRLIEAAKEVFERDGFLNARIASISETAGVGFGTFYHYFDSKEEIFREVASELEARLVEAPILQSEYSHGDDIWNLIRGSIRAYLERYREEAALIGVVEQVSRYDKQVAEGRAATLEQLARQWVHNIALIQAAGQADSEVDPALASDALRAMFSRFAELWLVDERRDYEFDHVVDQLTILCGNAIGLKAKRIFE